MHPLSRRRFLRASVGGFAALAAGYAGYSVWPFQGSPSASNTNVEPITRTGHALGTTVSLTAIPNPNVSRQRANTQVAAALDAAFAELDQIENVLSLYRPHSELCRLNAQGHLDQPHPYLMQVLRASLAMSQRTSGAFDVTVQPLWKAHAQAQKNGGEPDALAIANARQAVGYQRISIHKDRIAFIASDGPTNAPMSITFNGIAQGFAVDRVKAVLQAHSITSALLDVGELAALGRNQDAQPWQVGIQHPREPDAYAALAKLDQRSLATSGDYATSFTPDRTSHHLIDPRTGQSPGELASVSIVAPTAMEADALSTALFILGYDKSMALIDQSRNVDALFVFKDGRQAITPGFPQMQL